MAKIETIQELIEDSFLTAELKGWHEDPPRTVPEDVSLFHSEASELLEDHRNHRAPTEIYYETGELDDKTMTEIETVLMTEGVIPYPPERRPDLLQRIRECTKKDVAKPCGIPIELADIVIRVADFAKKHGIDLVEAIQIKADYNRTRPHRHGGKKL